MRLFSLASLPTFSEDGRQNSKTKKGQIMKLKKISALFLAAASVAGVSYAGTFGFEDVASSSIPQNSAALQNNAYTGGDLRDFQDVFTGGHRFSRICVLIRFRHLYRLLGGGMVSNQKGNSATTYTDDLQSKPGGAASGNNFGVIYVPSLDMSDFEDEDVLNNTPKLNGDPVFGDAFCSIFYKNFPNPTSLITDTKVEFTSLDIALTAYDYYTLENGNSMTGTVNGGTYDPVENPYKSISNTDGSVLRAESLRLLDDSGTLHPKNT